MGLFSGVKKLYRDVTGKTAAREIRRAGRGQERAIQAGQAMQQAQVAPAIEDVIRGAQEAGAAYLPYRAAGQRALGGMEELAAQMGGEVYRPAEYRPPTAEEVAASPAARFRMQEAERALERRQAAGAGVMGGGAQRELARYMQGLASQEYEAEDIRRLRAAQFQEQQRQFAPQFERQGLAQRLAALQGITGMGLETAGGVAGIRERLGQMMSGIRTGSGAAQAAATQAAGQARASGAIAGAAARQQAMGNLMRLGGTLGGAYMTGGTSLLAQGAGD